ncbi:DUF3108 domain-containing protein [Plastorhodobacter daqingensis]|uniref:DUF3108 domain-containing protein n=1 Tax=Plastorhodobacter daqingensis TaxID=1387281 RepID=A0ABW2UH22_9RHOB
MLKRRILALTLAIAASGPALAYETQAAFDLNILGLRAGTFVYSAVERDGQYAVNGRMESAGIIGAMRKIRYDAAVRGIVSNNRFVPVSYEGSSDTGRRQSASAMEFRNGVPQVMSYSPPREPDARDVDPSTQAGTVDPLTALFAALRDIPEAQACTHRIAIFDGRRRSEVAIGNRREADGRVTCTGEYRRVAGYSEREMSERQTFPFRITYSLSDDIARVQEVTMDSVYGRAVLRRR